MDCIEAEIWPRYPAIPERLKEPEVPSEEPHQYQYSSMSYCVLHNSQLASGRRKNTDMKVEHRFYPGQYGCKRALSFPRTALHELPHERPSATDAEIWATHSTLVTSQASASNWICSSTSTWTYSSTFPFLTCSSISTAHAAPPPPRPAATPFFFDLQLHFYLHLQFHLHLDLQLHLLFFNI
ncbi:uncharacterized protein [Dasypus novemcinctus]|uniref:uncharacterized protein isoform X2 n=1 Tax=Dasypus novemcinctus TaxID=9361 RepID=UPI00265DF48C|nr:uncharacterized protein LOC131273661 isoform X2 [Dasypus novemcinctus]XP_058133471.1 uncharacterized protein LOC131273661 isoform X2 [Dasypus novemcinctus]